MNQIILIIIFFITIAYLIYLGNKKNPMSISATEDIMKINNVTEMEKQQIMDSHNQKEVVDDETINEIKKMMEN